MATIHNVDLTTGTNYFSSSAANLPIGMFSQKELTGHGMDGTLNMRMGLWGALTGKGDKSELPYTETDIYNALPRDTNDLETVVGWDYTDNNTSFNSIDEHQPYNSASISKSIQLANYENTIEYENPFKISSDVLNSMNRYQYVYKKSLVTQLYSYQVNQNNETFWTSQIVNVPVTPSLFNPFLGVISTGMADNIPLVDLEDDSDAEIKIETDLIKGDNAPGNKDTDKTWKENENKKNVLKREKDLSDCSIKTLVKLSNDRNSSLGRERYKWADFMYCKDLGKYSNNMLITLRKFSVPIGDNISNDYGYGDTNDDSNGNTGDNKPKEINMPPDIGRMVAWLGKDNKLEDIIKFTTKDSWRELTAEDLQEQTKEDETMIGGLLSLANPEYRKSVAAGVAGGHNPLLGMFASDSSFFSNQGQYEGNPAMNGTHYDSNKVYTRTGTVQDTHVYEGKMTFTHSFRLVFDYELRAYENINPKAAFLDLLGNILITCYRKGTFWGGQRSFIGGPGPGSSSGWNMANDFIDAASDTTGGLVEHFLSGGKGGINVSDALGKLGLKNFSIDSLKNAITGGFDKLSDNAHSIGEVTGSLLGSMIKNKFGRPQVYAFKSLLTGDPVGLWHVTIGNPRNPILSMGNLIIDSTDYQFYGPLGIDDFPTGLKVTVNLKHAKSRDAGEIANMFTKGQTTVIMSLIGGNSSNELNDFCIDSEKDYNYRTYGSDIIIDPKDHKKLGFVGHGFVTAGS